VQNIAKIMLQPNTNISRLRNIQKTSCINFLAQ